MPRRPRLVYPGVPLHIIQRGNNRQACFFAEDDYLFYLDCLQKYAKEAGCAIHAFILMTNHVHLLLTPAKQSSAGQLMKRLGQRYVQYINRTYKRTGTLWEVRFRSCITQQENYLLICQRYIELNPVRASMVEHPGEYRWSSYRTNALGENSQILTPHSIYLLLGKTIDERQTAYGALFNLFLEPDIIDNIRRVTNGNFALGSDRFQDEIAHALNRRVKPGAAGRPRKQKV